MSLLDKFKKPFEKIGTSEGTGKQVDTADATSTKKKAAPKDTAKKGAAASTKKTAKKDEKKDGKKPEKIALKDTSGRAAGVIIKPLQTEKVTDQMALGKYTFEVAETATKNEIKKAIKAMYKVDAVKVHIINVRGKAVRFGRIWSKRKNWRKAIVTLKPGEKIEVYEGV